MNGIEKMGNIHTTAIFMDKYKIALREWCPTLFIDFYFFLWHILSKLPQKFKNTAVFDKTIVEFKAVVGDRITIGIFDRKWIEFLKSHGMKRSEWLKTLYNERENCTHVYLNHIFWSCMFLHKEVNECMIILFAIFTRWLHLSNLLNNMILL